MCILEYTSKQLKAMGEVPGLGPAIGSVLNTFVHRFFLSVYVCMCGCMLGVRVCFFFVLLEHFLFSFLVPFIVANKLQANPLPVSMYNH